MKILQIVPELRSGGVERGTVDLARYLRQKGHEAVVVSAGGPLVAGLLSAGVTHYTLPVHRKSPFSIFRSVRALTKIVRLERVDVIHARSRVPALIAFFVSRRTEVPFITTCHGIYSQSFLSRVMGWGKLTIVGSHRVGRHMRDDFGVPHERIRLIHRGVDLKEFMFRERQPEEAGQTAVVGCIGRLTPIKGHSFFLKAMARVARVHPNVKIQIIGDAPKMAYKEELLALTRSLGLTACVEFLGTRYDIPDLLSRMSVLVVPSVGEEAFGRVAIEAGARGIPVVATRLGGLVEIIEHEKTGLLVAADDSRQLADAVLRILRDAELGRSLANALRKKVEEEFSLDRMFEGTVAAYRETTSRMKILVIKLSAVGDVILSIPSLKALKRKYPQARLSVLVGAKARNIVRNCPYVDDTLVFDAGTESRFSAWTRMAQTLARENFDMVVDLQNNRVSHFLAYFCGARVRTGHDNGKWAFFLNRRASPAAGPIGPLDHQLRVLATVGVEMPDQRLELWSTPEEEERVRLFLESQWVSPSQVLVGVNPGSSLRWPTKQWPIENFARLCDELAKRNVRVVLTGSAEDRPAAEALLALTRNKPVNAVGRTSITELIALVARCRVFISSDSAPMHVASSVGVPLVALFGPTDPRRHLVEPRHARVIWKELSCSPCYLRNCPIGHPCMKKISVQEVLDAVTELAKTAPGAPRPEPAGVLSGGQ